MEAKDFVLEPLKFAHDVGSAAVRGTLGFAVDAGLWAGHQINRALTDDPNVLRESEALRRKFHESLDSKYSVLRYHAGNGKGNALTTAAEILTPVGAVKAPKFLAPAVKAVTRGYDWIAKSAPVTAKVFEKAATASELAAIKGSAKATLSRARAVSTKGAFSGNKTATRVGLAAEEGAERTLEAAARGKKEVSLAEILKKPSALVDPASRTGRAVAIASGKVGWRPSFLSAAGKNVVEKVTSGIIPYAAKYGTKGALEAMTYPNPPDVVVPENVRMGVSEEDSELAGRFRAIAAGSGLPKGYVLNAIANARKDYSARISAAGNDAERASVRKTFDGYLDAVAGNPSAVAEITELIKEHDKGRIEREIEEGAARKVPEFVAMKASGRYSDMRDPLMLKMARDYNIKRRAEFDREPLIDRLEFGLEVK